MKYLILLLVSVFASVLLFSLPLQAQEDAGVLKAKLAILEAERDASMKKMSDMRMKHIRADRNLKRMHDRIMELHRNLALALDAKPEIREMNDKIIKLDSEIESVDKKLKTAKPKKEEAPGSEPKKGEK